MLKPILKITGIVLLLIFASALAAPIFFKGKILSLVKSEINKNVVADVTFSDLDISLFRNFPKLSAGLDRLIVTGRDDFRKDTLLSAEKIDIALNSIYFILLLHFQNSKKYSRKSPIKSYSLKLHRYFFKIFYILYF